MYFKVVKLGDLSFFYLRGKTVGAFPPSCVVDYFWSLDETKIYTDDQIIADVHSNIQQRLGNDIYYDLSPHVSIEDRRISLIVARPARTEWTLAHYVPVPKPKTCQKSS